MIGTLYEMLIKITIATTKIFLSDFNARNKNQNCVDIDSNNKRFENIVEVNNLYLHNTNFNTHIIVYCGQKSNLDLIFFNFSYLDKLNKKV